MQSKKSLYAESCHNSNVSAKMNLNLPLPPPYAHEVWDYDKANMKNIKRSIKTCNWTKLFVNLPINERQELLSNMLINIFRNYIPNKKVKSKYDEALQVTKNIKFALHKRSRLTKRYYINNQVECDYNLLLNHSKNCREMIPSAKNEYVRTSKKLNPSVTPKSYWSILNWFLKNKKITSIPPIFHNDKVISKKHIPAIIKSLDPNKSHGWKNISLKMIQTC